MLTALEKLQEKTYNSAALFQSWWSHMLAVSVSIIFLLKLSWHSLKKPYEAKLKTKKWKKSIDILNGIHFQWSNEKTVKIKFYLGKIEKGIQTLKTENHFTFIHPKEK